MGNFSRNTFDRTKNYVAVRLQQGVPLVDADWNELDDIARHELYTGLRAALPSIARRGGLDVTAAGPNDLGISAGSAVIDGFPTQLWGPLQYSTQRYADAARATADGVARAAPLTQPGGPRSDAVYLDVFEREVTNVEDPTLVNAAIGVPTATRLRREVVLRVAEGASSPPAPAAGHAHLHVAQLNRTASAIAPGQIVDVKPYALPLGQRELGVAPRVEPLTSDPAAPRWSAMATTSDAVPRVFAQATPAANVISGAIPLALPDRANIVQVRILGSLAAGSVTLRVKVVRGRLDFSGTGLLVNETISGFGAVARSVAPAPAEAIVDNASNYYYVHVQASGSGTVVLHGLGFRYTP